MKSVSANNILSASYMYLTVLEFINCDSPKLIDIFIFNNKFSLKKRLNVLTYWDFFTFDTLQTSPK